MNYTISFVEDRSIVLVEITGTFNAQPAKVFALEATNIARNRDSSRVVFDTTDTKLDASTIQLFDLASHLDNAGITKSDLKVAVVYSSDKKDHIFFETVAKNRGWANVSYFQFKEEAIKWLTR